ncbi:MAG: DUF4149 domain-containing protein [Holophaga sp.]|nr:DUF4149 domain-containing protein [Holophaga sp.]
MGLLLVWLGMALGFAFLQAPTTFQVLGDRDLAGRIVGATLVRLDWAAWGAFALALGLSWVPRWLEEFKEMDGLGPLRLWSAAALVALLMCLASSFILTPKLADIRERAQVPIQTLSENHPDRILHAKAHRISRQLLVLRMLLALSLVAGIGYLPRRKDAEPA